MFHYYVLVAITKTCLQMKVSIQYILDWYQCENYYTNINSLMSFSPKLFKAIPTTLLQQISLPLLQTWNCRSWWPLPSPELHNVMAINNITHFEWSINRVHSILMKHQYSPCHSLLHMAIKHVVKQIFSCSRFNIRQRKKMSNISCQC